MPVEIIPSFLLYCLVSGITPGPANLSSLATAVRRGRAPAIRQWYGILVGYTIVMLCSGLLAFFVGQALNEHVAKLSFVGAAYILWLAYKMLRESCDDAEESRPFKGFVSGLFIQLTNVKIMIFGITAQTTFMLPYNRSVAAVMLFALILSVTGPSCNMVWLLTGVKLRDIFSKYQKPIGIAMAISLVACAVSILMIG